MKAPRAVETLQERLAHLNALLLAEQHSADCSPRYVEGLMLSIAMLEKQLKPGRLVRGVNQ